MRDNTHSEHLYIKKGKECERDRGGKESDKTHTERE